MTSELNVEKMFNGIPKKVDLNSGQIIAALKSKHNTGGEWETFEEFTVWLPNIGERRIDLFVIGNWRSSVRTISYEVKISRADFLSELEHPEKRHVAEEISCETWFVVPTNLVREDEVPENWGLMYCNNNLRLSKKKIAKQRKMDQIPTRVLSSVCKRLCQYEAMPPRKLFKYAGKDISENDLLKLAKDCLKKDNRHESAVWEGRRLVHDSPEFKRDRSISNAVRSHCGHDIQDGKAFLEWVKTHEGKLSKETIRQIQCLIRSANELIGENI